MKIGILQLHRIGDIIMSLNAIRAIKSLNPAAEIYLINRERFSIKGLTEFDYLKIIELKTAHILSQKNVKLMLQEIKNFGNDLPSFDMVFNFSFSPTSLAFTRLLRANKIIGPHLDENGVEKLDDDCSFYIRSHIQGGDGTNRMHLLPLWLQMTGITKEKFVKLAQPLEKVQSAVPTIAIHVGSSVKTKNLSLPDWVTLVKMIETKFKDHTIVMLGGDTEKTFGELISKHFPKIKNLIGKLEIYQVYEEISMAQGFIGVDSMASHLAALSGTYSLVIYIDETITNPFETLAFSKNTYGCKGDIPSIVASFEELIMNGKIEQSRNAKIYGWVSDMAGVVIKSHHADQTTAKYRTVWMSIARGERIEKFHFMGLEGNLFQDMHGLKQFIRSLEITVESLKYLKANELSNRLIEIRDLQKTLYGSYFLLRHPCEELWLEESILSGGVEDMIKKYQSVAGSIINSCKIFEAAATQLLNDQLRFSTDKNAGESQQNQGVTVNSPSLNALHTKE